MASFTFPKLPFSLFLSLSIFLNAERALGGIKCEDLAKETCAFSIDSSGRRCLLENSIGNTGVTEYQCRTSAVVVEKMSDWIESEKCVSDCGVDRNSVGISSDSLLEPQFLGKLCSPKCYHECPNIVDLYHNLAAGEGVVLVDLCKEQRSNPHRAMAEIMSSGVAPGPVSGGSSSGVAPGPVSGGSTSSFSASPDASSFAPASPPTSI